MPAVPFIWIAKHYTKWYKDHWTEVITDKLNKQKKLEVTKETNKALSVTMSDINSKNTKKAA
jgi:hypothetical protein